jgi:hypothetical protein
MLQYARYMHKYAIGKYAHICPNMRKYARNMQVYARPQISSVLPKNARNMQDIWTYMQNLQARILYALYAHICIPHFADVESKPLCSHDSG